MATLEEKKAEHYGHFPPTIDRLLRQIDEVSEKAGMEYWTAFKIVQELTQQQLVYEMQQSRDELNHLSSVLDIHWDLKNLDESFRAAHGLSPRE